MCFINMCCVFSCLHSGALEEDLSLVKEENRYLREMLSVLCESNNVMRRLMKKYRSKARNEKKIISGQLKKRKSKRGNNSNDITYTRAHRNSEVSSSTGEESNPSKKPNEEVIESKISMIYVRTEASDNSLVVKDEYQWRKYGQKVRRYNPSPIAYFKCYFAPSCPAKKKVQISAEDKSVLVASYEEEHNHAHPSQMETALALA